MKSLGKKRGISEIVSYVLLIIIAMSIAVGVYAWLKSYVPSEEERQKCPEETALSITDYECMEIAGKKILSLKIENRGLFNVDGFYIRASNDSKKLPTYDLSTIDIPEIEVVPGQYFKPVITGTGLTANFTYGNLSKIERVQIQAIYGTTICSVVSDIKLENC